MARRRIPYVFEDFRGEDNTSGLQNQKVYGHNGAHKQHRLRNYHLIGPGRARKRNGYKDYSTEAIAGANAGQGVGIHDVLSTRQLVAVCNGQVKVLDETAKTWTDLTGALSLSGDASVQTRFGAFNDGTNRWMLASNGTDKPWLWAGDASSPAVTLESVDANAPATNVVGFTEFHGYPLLLTYDDLFYAPYGAMDNWANKSIISVSRGSLGFALHRHSRDVALVFFEDGIFRLEFNPLEGTTFRALPVENSEPCIARSSIITQEGKTFWAGERGIYRCDDPTRGAAFIGEDIEEFWRGLNQGRRALITAVKRGQPWREVGWLATYGANNTRHNVVMLYNIKLDAWSIFPVATTTGKQEFSCGTSFVDADGIPRTIVIGYDGIAYEAWGHTLANSGYTDDGARVRSEFSTGFLNCDYAGVSNTRQLILDIEAHTSKTFDISAEAIGKPPVNSQITIAGGGALLDVGFMLDESLLSISTVTQGQGKMLTSGRYVMVTITEEDDDVPHVLSGFTIMHMRGGARMNA